MEIIGGKHCMRNDYRNINLFMRALNSFIFCDDCISFGREFHIFGPKKRTDFIP